MLTRPTLYEAEAAKILPLLQDAPVIISRRVAHSLQVTRIIFIATSIAVITLNENNLRHRLIYS